GDRPTHRGSVQGALRAGSNRDRAAHRPREQTRTCRRRRAGHWASSVDVSRVLLRYCQKNLSHPASSLVIGCDRRRQNPRLARHWPFLEAAVFEPLPGVTPLSLPEQLRLPPIELSPTSADSGSSWVEP